MKEWKHVSRKFSGDFLARMRKLKLRRKKVAQLADVTSPYITHLLSGNKNLTLETMSKFASAVGCEIEITLKEK